MKRRLRKKRHLGEFRQYAFVLAARYEADVPEEKLDDRLDQLIRFVESRNLGVTGGGGREIEMYVARLCSSRRCVQCNRKFNPGERPFGPVSSDDQSAVVSLMQAMGAKAIAGPLFDAYHHSEAEYEASIPKLEG